MTTNPHTRRLAARAAEIEAELAKTNEPTGLDGQLWRHEAERYATIADALLNSWRADHPKQRPHVVLHDGPMAD